MTRRGVIAAVLAGPAASASAQDLLATKPIEAMLRKAGGRE